MQEKNAERLRLEKQRALDFMQEHLPFFLRGDFNSCYAHKLYLWQKELILCRTPIILLTAANQVGKSSGQILRACNQAMRQDLWPYWFPQKKPRTFLYLYPEAKLATLEWREKWTKEYMPRGKMIEDPRFGWTASYSKGAIESVRFASGVTLYFRNYTQSPTSIQAATADAVFLDEECPEEHFNELHIRTAARRNQGSGYVSMVFTATLGQSYLYKAMELRGMPDETFKGAWKKQVSAFDCLHYADGTASKVWTREYLEKEFIPSFHSKAEVDRRVYGRFIKTSGLIYEDFDFQRNTEEEKPFKEIANWSVWVGMDFGAGGHFGHSSSIVFIAVDPTYTEARVIWSWSSEKNRMTQGDLLSIYISETPKLEHTAYADWAATDLFELAQREGIPLNRPEKSHEHGIPLINTLLKTGALKIWLGPNSGSNIDIVREMQSINEGTPKRKRIDDMTDGLRYGLSMCPLHINPIKKEPREKKEPINPRMAFYRGLDRKDDPMFIDQDTVDALDEAISMFEDLL